MALYRLSVKVGNAGAGRSHFDYISRDGKYKKDENKNLKEDLIYSQTFNMPSWAKNPRDFWKEEEKAKDGFRKIEVALPNEMNAEQQKDLLEDFLKSEFGEDYVYSYAIHHSKGILSGEENPHAHIMFCERKRDKSREEPTRENWFKKSRTRKDGTISGGYKKDTKFKKQTGSNWINEIRERWEKKQNYELEKIGCMDKVSSKTLKKQGIKRLPQKHLGIKRCRMLMDTQAKTDYQEIKAFQYHNSDIQELLRANRQILMIKQELDVLRAEFKVSVKEEQEPAVQGQNSQNLGHLREEPHEEPKKVQEERKPAVQGQNSQNLGDVAPAEPPQKMSYQQKKMLKVFNRVVANCPNEVEANYDLVCRAISVGASALHVEKALKRDEPKKHLERLIKREIEANCLTR